jgi:hypothetical protein
MLPKMLDDKTFRASGSARPVHFRTALYESNQPLPLVKHASHSHRMICDLSLLAAKVP